ncbi:LysM peptidoglycan-binding domain-containing protein [Lacrimispora sp. NSJ-141]|uniref:LysM peptidoglycan-binding domain-containing protein n=1 Tax=Lientehia hominis TaxID=2897778 RepID=A0AAP2RFL8_9FIRM|nr:LysM peptidoglycan-binding domain-containing protein [Lientehia hominis]MCD2491071.1 LysM peptidoglycan-binding domain-containing protein [Lientehia hominis]
MKNLQFDEFLVEERRADMRNRTRYSRRKVKFAAILGAILMFSVIFFSVFVSAKSSRTDASLYKYYTAVQIDRGDTLWNIAKEYCPDPNQLKSYVKELKNINHLKSDEIHAGNYLTVVYYSEEYK